MAAPAAAIAQRVGEYYMLRVESKQDKDKFAINLHKESYSRIPALRLTDLREGGETKKTGRLKVLQRPQRRGGSIHSHSSKSSDKSGGSKKSAETTTSTSDGRRSSSPTNSITSKESSKSLETREEEYHKIRDRIFSEDSSSSKSSSSTPMAVAPGATAGTSSKNNKSAPRGTVDEHELGQFVRYGHTSPGPSPQASPLNRSPNSSPATSPRESSSLLNPNVLSQPPTPYAPGKTQPGPSRPSAPPPPGAPGGSGGGGLLPTPPTQPSTVLAGTSKAPSTSARSTTSSEASFPSSSVIGHILEVVGLPPGTKPFEAETQLGPLKKAGASIRYDSSSGAIYGVFSSAAAAQQAIKTVKTKAFRLVVFDAARGSVAGQ